MNIKYDTWKPRYTDEYTCGMLSDDLVQAATIDELDYVNQHVWEIDTLDHMKTIPNNILVRLRWGMANKATPGSLMFAQGLWVAKSTRAVRRLMHVMRQLHR